MWQWKPAQTAARKPINGSEETGTMPLTILLTIQENYAPPSRPEAVRAFFFLGRNSERHERQAGKEKRQ
jgi:hypothetical protein